MVKASARISSPAVRNVDPNDVVSKTRNWYSERYENVLVQRNILLLIVLLAIIVISASVFIAGQVSMSRTVQPFVVQVEPRTGFATVVDPKDVTGYSFKDNLYKYFLVNYIRARESYTSSSFDYNINTIVRMLSSSAVYNDIANKIRQNDPTSPSIRFAGTDAVVKIKSVQIIDDKLESKDTSVKKAATATIRFSVSSTSPDRPTYDKIATVEFEIKAVGLNQEELYINPVGFQVTKYVVSDETIS